MRVSVRDIRQLQPLPYFRCNRTGNGSKCGSRYAEKSYYAVEQALFLDQPAVSRQTHFCLARPTPHEFPHHFASRLHDLPAVGAFVDKEQVGDGNRGVAVGTTDGQTNSLVIDDKVFPAHPAFEEDVGHALDPRPGGNQGCNPLI
jgi:hypothetical protein